MATHSGILAWKIPGAEEPGGLQSTGSHRVGHDCATAQTGAGGGGELSSARVCWTEQEGRADFLPTACFPGIVSGTSALWGPLFTTIFCSPQSLLCHQTYEEGKGDREEKAETATALAVLLLTFPCEISPRSGEFSIITKAF